MNIVAMLALQARPAASPMIGPAITLVSFALIMYFIIIRPQRKIQADHQTMLSGVKPGDEVMTEGGIIGKVVHVADDRVTIKSAESRIVVAKLKIARVMTGTTATTTES